MSKRETKISLSGSAENENISIVVDEDIKMINILRQNANRTYQETYSLENIKKDSACMEFKFKDNDFDNRLKTLETKVNVLESKVDKSTL